MKETATSAVGAVKDEGQFAAEEIKDQAQQAKTTVQDEGTSAASDVQGQAQQVLMWIGLNLVITFTLPGISWQGHLGGLVAGAAIGAAMVYAPKQRRSLVQWGAVAAVALLAVVAIALRALALA